MGKRSCGSVFGGPAKYKWLVLKIQEYPINKEMLRLAGGDITPSAGLLRERCSSGYMARPTEVKAMRIAELRRRVEEVDAALRTIPEEYREGVLYHTVHYGTRSMGRTAGTAWDDRRFDFAHKNTWKKWKTRFILAYAGIIGELDYIKMLNEYREAAESGVKNKLS